MSLRNTIFDEESLRSQDIYESLLQSLGNAAGARDQGFVKC
jgi:hypothetical protein